MTIPLNIVRFDTETQGDGVHTERDCSAIGGTAQTSRTYGHATLSGGMTVDLAL